MERKNEEAEHILRGDYTVIDLEMTGLNPKLDKVIEIGAVRGESETEYTGAGGGTDRNYERGSGCGT